MKNHKNVELRLLLLIFGLVVTVGAQTVPSRPNRTPVLVSASSVTGGAAGADSYLNSAVPRSALSADGRYVLFQSDAREVVTDVHDGNFATCVFVHNRLNKKTTLVSVNRDGQMSGNGPSASPFISADGRFVAYESFAGDLVERDDNGLKDIFVRDLQKGVTRLVTVNRQGGAS